MKSTMIKRMLALMLAFVLVALLPVNAFAASVSWTDESGSYVASVTANSTNNKYVATGIGRTHTYGTATTISPSSSTNYTVSSENLFNAVEYRDKILSALSSSGYSLTRTVTLTTSSSVVVPSSATSGYYYFALYVHGSNISVRVTGTKVDGDGIGEISYNKSYNSTYTPKSSGYTLSYIRG